MKNFNKPVVLVAPLDWGLGHASRCIPIITALLTFGCEVLIAAEGRQQALLASEFPGLKFLKLPGYHISYGDSASNTKLKLIAQIPKLVTAIRLENKWLEETIKNFKPDLVISDNRYGLHNKSIPSIFITHQLLIKTGFGRLFDYLLRQLNYRLIRNFTYCWVPDYNSEINLAGVLAHPTELPATETKYIGPLSRFADREKTEAGGELLIILSGPEPQRSLLEKMLLSGLQTYQGKAILLRGLPGENGLPENNNPGLQIYNHLPAEKLERLIISAKAVVCRSGYSSVMDLIPLGKSCVFIPTPGQPEQEYLASYLSSKNWCITFNQEKFSFQEMEKVLSTFKPEPFTPKSELLKAVIEETLVKLLDPAAIYLRKNFVG